MQTRINDRWMAVGGLCIAAVAMVAIAAIVWINPDKRTLLPLYRECVEAWWSRSAIYTDPYGFNYLPHFVLLFSPFHWMGVPVGDVAWRVVSMGWLLGVLWQLVGITAGRRSGRHMLWLVVAAGPVGLGAVANGQANAMFAAATAQAVVFIIHRRWGAAAAMMLLALAFKPLGLVMIGLAPIIYRPLIARLLGGAIIFMAVPFLFGPPAYVLAQLQAFGDNIMQCGALAEHRFANVNGVLRTLRFEPAGMPSTVIALVAAVFTLGAWIVGARGTAEPRKALLLLSLTASYLMLFNPMNESNGYVILAPALAVQACAWWEGGPRWGTWAAAALMLWIGVLPELVRDWAPSFSLWAKPMATMVFIAIVLTITMKRRTTHA